VDSDPSPRLPWAFLVALVALVVALLLVLLAHEAPDLTLATRLRAAVALGPLLVAAVAPVLPRVGPRVGAALRALGHRRVAAGLAALTVWSVLAPAARFDPYWAVLLALWAAVPVLAQRLEPTPGRLTPLVLLAWLVWWIPLDLRWYGTLWTGPRELGYATCALLVAALALVTFGCLGDAGPGSRPRPPRPGDLLAGVVALLAFGALAIPLGLALGFLRAHGPALGPSAAALRGLEIALTVALPEEVYFRGVLDAGLRPLFRRPLASLAVSSLAFGLMHWNNRGDLAGQLSYLGLASVAGVFYGLAFRRGGLAASVLCHTSVDLLWDVFLRK
jgi:membrane protease YdiL (CAAX protease family)